VKVLRYHLAHASFEELRKLARFTKRSEPDVMRDVLWLGLGKVRPPIPYKVLGSVVPRALTVTDSFRAALSSRAKKLMVSPGQRNSFINEIAKVGLASYREEVQLFRAEMGALPEGAQLVDHAAVEQNKGVRVPAVQGRRAASRQ
jgi:hypothetical protein